MGWLTSLLSSILVKLLEKLSAFLVELYQGYQKRRENERTTSELKEKLINAKTPEEKQAAGQALARHLGRRP